MRSPLMRRHGPPQLGYGAKTWIVSVRIPASAVLPPDRIPKSTVIVCNPEPRPVFRYETVVRCATGRLIPPSTSNPVAGNGLPSAFTWILAAFPDGTLRNWLVTSTLTVHVRFRHRTVVGANAATGTSVKVTRVTSCRRCVLMSERSSAVTGSWAATSLRNTQWRTISTRKRIQKEISGRKLIISIFIPLSGIFRP